MKVTPCFFPKETGVFFMGYIDNHRYERYNIDNHKCEVDQVKSKYSESAKIFKAFGDENRLRILELLGTGEKCACKLLEDLQISQSTLSHHMKLLCDAGVVRGRKEGKWVHYSIDPEGAAYVNALFWKQLCMDENPKENS